MERSLCLLVVLGVFASAYAQIGGSAGLTSLSDLHMSNLLGRTRKNKEKRQTVVEDEPKLLGNEGYGYNSLVLATSWAGTTCRVKKCNNNRPPIKTFFNLHGLWPNDSEVFENTPFNCLNSNVKMSVLPKEVQDLTNMYWNPLYGSAETFLNHEWTKHGTCWIPQPLDANVCPSEIRKLVEDAALTASNNQALKQSDYFKVSIALAQKYNIFSALASSGILPHNNKKYGRDIIERALFSYFKVNALDIKCAKNPATGDSMLQEVRVCMDLNYQIISCRRHNMQCANQILYPEYI